MKQEHIIQVDPAKCIGCGLCKKDCPASNIAIEQKKAVILSQTCILCGHCVAVCPKAAVSMTGFDEPPLEIDAQERLSPEALLQAIRTRRSIRQFTTEPVAPETLHRIIEAGRLTPTGGNAQNVSFIILQDGLEQAEKMAVRLFRRLLPLISLFNPVAKRTAIDDHFFFKKAPAVIVIVSPDEINGALAASNMALMAESCGLGVLYSGFFATAANHSRALKQTLGLKHGDKITTALVLGHPGVTYHRTAQKEAATIRHI